MKEVGIIFASTTCGGIGYQNTLPWDIPEELKHFRKITTTVNNNAKRNCIIMGKNTWHSIPNKPLKKGLILLLPVMNMKK